MEPSIISSITNRKEGENLIRMRSFAGTLKYSWIVTELAVPHDSIKSLIDLDILILLAPTADISSVSKLFASTILSCPVLPVRE